MRAHGEDDLQKAIVQHLIMRGNKAAIYWHTPNQGLRTTRYAARLKAMGTRAGIPDLAFVLPDGRAAFVELKTPGGRLSKEQALFMDKCIAQGIPHAVCADLDSVLAILTEWQVLR